MTVQEAVDHATTIVKKLRRANHIAYFAGGWVRDFVMGHPSEDIDIATSATPSQIMDVFPKTILVGLAFGVVIIVMEGHQFEVATFRKDLHYIDGRHPEGIALTSTPRDDALRRDFTINGMFYDPIENIIHDYVHGQEDIKKGIIRTIGDPHERFFEDRLRILRAFRFSARFGFPIHPDTQEAIKEHADKLFPAVAMERVWQEFNKMCAYPLFDQAILDMHRLSVLGVIFPEVAHLHLNDLRHCVSSYVHFPLSCPTILYLMELFPHAKLSEKSEIARRLKVPTKNIKLLEYFEEVSRVVDREENGCLIEDYVWAKLFSDDYCQVCLEVIAAHYPEKKRKAFLEKKRALFSKLEPHILRIRAGKTLVTSVSLIKRGIRPGKKMGMLIKEGEKIAVNENLHEEERVIQKLEEIPLWKQGS